jgi:ribosomal protein S18 acetylase RimI-like enzyme
MLVSSHRIVLATPEDFPHIERIARATWPDTFGSILSAEQIDYMLDLMYRKEALCEQLERGHVFHLLLDADRPERSDYSGRATRFRPVAYVSHEIDYLPRTTKIHKLYVLPGAQGKGFGKALIDHVVRLARRRDQQKLRLDVNYQNRAVDFYRRLGFQKIARHDTQIGNGYLMEDWQMELIL